MKRSDNQVFDYSVIDNGQPLTLPFFTQPFHDEIFSSWVLRCSHLYKMKPHVFSKFIWGTTNIWNRDIDKSIKEEDINKFSKMNHTDLERGLLTSLKSFEGFLFDEIKINGQCKLINTVGVYHRQRKYYALMYCPNCLIKKKYFQKKWRLAILVCCPECSIDLHDRCYNCQSPILPFRLNISEKNLYHDLYINHCWYCKVDLCKAPHIKANSEIIYFTKQINFHLTDVERFKKNTKYFFNRVSFFTRILASNKTLINYLSAQNICAIPNNSEGIKNFPLEMLPLSDRKEILLGLIYLLKNWPENFKKYIKINNVRYSDLVYEKAHKISYPEELKTYLYKNIVK